MLDQPSVLFNSHRLAIMLELSHAGAVDFIQLRHDLELTDGALATHMKALTKDRFVESKKEQVETRERTVFILTRDGMDALDRFLNVISEIRGEIKSVTG